MDSDLISKSVLLKDIENNYDCNYGETLINPRYFYDLVDDQPTVKAKPNWISTKDFLPEEDTCNHGRHKIDVIVETDRGLITKVQRIHRRNYDGIYDDWYWGRIYGSVIAWQPLPERYVEVDE